MLASSAALLACAPAHAVTFNLIDTGGTAVDTQARQGFEAAAFYWSSALTNNVTVDLRIGFNALGTGILGSTSSTSALELNSAYYTALYNNITSASDLQAVTSLRPLGVSAGYGLNSLTVQTNPLNAADTGYLDPALRIDNDGLQNNNVVAINTSTAKALGLTTDANGRAL